MKNKKTAAEDAASLGTKKVLTAQEAAQILGVSMSYLYKLTSARLIPHSKPTGKLCFFIREEVEQWAMQNRIATVTELNDNANRIIMKGGAK